MQSLPSESGPNVDVTEPSDMSPQKYYEANGYYVYRSLIPAEMVDRLVARYQQDIVSTNYPFFRQNTNVYEANKQTEHGYVKQSFLDIHDYRKFPEFSRAARDVYTSQAIRRALTEVTGFASFNMMQTMLFDANTETIPHQDWWYLDSVPNGFLLAAWIALEDIDERAGRFFVLPKSSSVDLHSDVPNLPHSEWIKRIAGYVEQHRSEVLAPAMKKGDVLFWNSRTIHGALRTQDPSFSRKSLTAHYMPSQMTFGNLFVAKKGIAYKTYNEMQFFRNQPDYSFSNKLKFAVKTGVYNSPRIMRNLRKVQSLLASDKTG